jgi:Uma2 family endonuclease
MSTATAKKAGEERFLRPLNSIEDLMNGRGYILHNGNFISKNEEGGYTIADVGEEREHTVDDYMNLPESAPFQLIDGKLIFMPSLKDIHQAISIHLATLLYLFVSKHKLGIVRNAPLDVHFDEKNIFQPDLLFISNERKHILKDWVYGAPDLVVEIISKGTASFDKKQKMETYGKYGVQEYWLIDPEKKTLQLFGNQANKMVELEKSGIGQSLKSKVLIGFEVEISELFA